MNRLVAILVAALALSAGSAFADEQADAAQSADYMDALARFEEGDYNAALARIDALYSNRTEDAYYCNFRGQILGKQSRLPEAKRMFEKAIELSPTNATARFHLAEMLFAEGNSAGAREQYERSLEARPDSPLAQYKLLICLLLLKEDAKAQSLLERAQISNTDARFYFFHAAWAFAHGDQDAGMYFLSAARWMYTAHGFRLFAQPLIQQGWLSEQEAGKDL